jgi:hypothetical protein
MVGLCNNNVMRAILTDYDLPILNGICYFISRPHFRIGRATHYENDNARNVPHVLLGFVFVPMSVASTNNIRIYITATRLRDS